MYGVPNNLDLKPFIGCTLDQIRLGAHQISFHFSGPGGIAGASLDVESKWLLEDQDGQVIDRSLRDDQLPSDRDVYRVHQLIGRAVASFVLDPPRSATLVFEGGDRLTVWDDSEQYESFHVEPGGFHI